MVLHQPQDVVNIAVVVRAMVNFGAEHLRLVRPQEFDPYRIEGIAHRGGAVAQRARLFDDLDGALADCVHVVGMTARGRAAKRNVQRPPDAAAELASFDASETCAILLGPEDRGLTNEELDRCNRIVTIPTTEEGWSMNLAQAATVMLYEIFTASHRPPLKRPRRAAPAAERELLEQVFLDAEAALEAIEFFKARTRTSIMRTVREAVHRASLDRREAGLLRAMCMEVLNYLSRKGVRPS